MDLITKLNLVSNIIHNTSLRGSGNYIITSLEIAESIDNIDKIRNRKRKIEKIMRRIK